MATGIFRVSCGAMPFNEVKDNVFVQSVCIIFLIRRGKLPKPTDQTEEKVYGTTVRQMWINVCGCA